MCASTALSKGAVSHRWGWWTLGFSDEEDSSPSLGTQRCWAQPAIQTQPLLHRGCTSPAAHTGSHSSGKHKKTLWNLKDKAGVFLYFSCCQYRLLHRQYLIVGSVHCWFYSFHGVNKKKNIEYHQPHPVMFLNQCFTSISMSNVEGVFICPPGGSSCCWSRSHPDYLPSSSECLWGVFKWSITGEKTEIILTPLQKHFSALLDRKHCLKTQSTALIWDNNMVYPRLWAEFLPKVPGLRLLAGRVPPLHVFNGESAQDSALQLHQRSPGLCWSTSRTHTTGMTNDMKGVQWH